MSKESRTKDEEKVQFTYTKGSNSDDVPLMVNTQLSDDQAKV